MISEIFSFLVGLISDFGYYAVFFGMVLESACIPIPSEIIMPLAGFLAFQGKMDFWAAVLVGTIASVVGSFIAYYAGLKGGRPFIEKRRFISKNDLSKADRFFDKYSIESVFIGRLVPVVRTFISLPAGIARTDVKKFGFYTLAGTFIWNSILTFAGFKLGQNWSLIYDNFHYLDIIVIVVVLVLLSYFSLKKFKVIK